MDPGKQKWNGHAESCILTALTIAHKFHRIKKHKGYWPGCPDLVAEVISPHDTDSEILAKALAWIEAGCKVVWIVDPKQKQVKEFRSETSIRIFTVRDRLSASEVFGDWSIEIGKLFQ